MSTDYEALYYVIHSISLSFALSSAFFSGTFNLCSYLSVKDKVSCEHETTRLLSHSFV